MNPTSTPLPTLIKEMREDAKSDMSFVVGSADILRVLDACEEMRFEFGAIAAAPFSCASCDDGLDPIHCTCDTFNPRKIARAVLAKHFGEESK